MINETLKNFQYYSVKSKRKELQVNYNIQNGGKYIF